MLTRRIIPCLDTNAGRVVKGVRFQSLRDIGSPVDIALEYQHQGADELVVLDISATPQDRRTHIDLVAAMRRSLSIPLCVGGGVREVEDARRLLEAGADKVAINSAAVHRPELITELSDKFGSQCIVVAIDAAARAGQLASWSVVTHSGSLPTSLNAIDWAIAANQHGAGEILLTSIDRDGTRDGYDLALISAVASVVRCPVIASGGASTPQHLADALAAGADAVLAASMFHDRNFSISNVKSFLKSQRFEVRP